MTTPIVPRSDSENNPITPTQLDAWRRMSEDELEDVKRASTDEDIVAICNQLIFIKRYEREISKCWDKINPIMQGRSPRTMREAAALAAPPQPAAPALTNWDKGVADMVRLIDAMEAPATPQPRPAQRVTLTKRQREYLQHTVDNGGTAQRRDWWYVASGRGNAQVMAGLVNRGLMSDTWNGWEITEAGKAALAADEAR